MDEIIKAIDEEIKKLQQVRRLLKQPNRTHVEKSASPNRRGKRRKLTAGARAKIAAAQRRRWAKQKRQTEKAPF